MENLQFRFEAGQRRISGPPVLVGVVGSGNLEVLLQAHSLNGGCEIDIRTQAAGFGHIWQAVLTDFHEKWQLADARISINDVGATPAVVGLRLDQALESAMAQGVAAPASEPATQPAGSVA
jgi:malonate decarboxylase delta subunit